MASRRKLILFFNRFFGQWPPASGLECQGKCEFTTDADRLPEADAVIFHLPTLPAETQVMKFAGQQWVAWCMESTVTCPPLADPDLLRHFDLAMTYRQDADVWCPYIHVEEAQGLMAPPPPRPESAPVVHFQSHRYDRSGRNRYAAELMKRVKVDSYGKVLNNRKLAAPDEGPDTMRAVMARYKFSLAFENSIAPDYVTDKFFDPLRAGTVPIYLGAPNVAELAPGECCSINVVDFQGPVERADHLNHLNENDDAYRAYFAWKSRGLTRRFRAHTEAVRRHFLCRLCDRVEHRNRGRSAGRPQAIRMRLHENRQPR